MILVYIILQLSWNSKTLILSLKNSNFSDIVYCQGRKTISSIWKAIMFQLIDTGSSYLNQLFFFM